MANKIKPTLTFSVTYLPGTGKFRVATRIAVLVGGWEVAHQTLGGRYTQKDAEREWKVNRRTFTVTEVEILKLAA